MNYKLNTWYEMADGYSGEVVYINIISRDKYIKYYCVTLNETNSEPYDFQTRNDPPAEFKEYFDDDIMESIKEVSERYIINANFS